MEKLYPVNITVSDFLRHYTKVGEMCILYDCGYIAAAAYIDHEDLFIRGIPIDILNHKVESDKFELMTITGEDGVKIYTQVHRINIVR